jgi:site-specific DNA-methyltransferase (adenine-specific)
MNQLYYGDNLTILRANIKDESVDLIYLDPPFNSKATYNLLFKSPKGHESHAQIEAFEDTWHWGDQAEKEFNELVHSSNTDVSEMIQALRRFLNENDMMAYLTMIANRLLELQRVLKETGSLYLHCDPTASHYLKIVLDGVFGHENFRNEIIWLRSTPKGLASKRLPQNHDVLLAYQKSSLATWNGDTLFLHYDPDNLNEKTAGKYSYRDEDGRIYRLSDLTNPNPDRPNLTYEFLGVTKVWRWTKERMQKAYEDGLVVQTKPGTVPQLKRYLDEQRGIPLSDVWTDISPINSQAAERLGYPTQKPVSLLERIISASSNEGDVVLDPFAGCGTAIHAAQKLRRNWIGIDITHLAIALVEKRIKDAFPGTSFEIHGTPKDFESAQDLANRDKYQFQWWACSLINAQPFQGKKKGADSGIDGLIYFQDDQSAIHSHRSLPKKIIVSVKGGENVSVAMIRDLGHVVDREKAEIGLFVTLAKPTRPMREEAVKAGYYQSPSGASFPKIQILTIEGLLNGTEQPRYPDLMRGGLMFKKAKKEVKEEQRALPTVPSLRTIQRPLPSKEFEDSPLLDDLTDDDFN